MLSFFDSNQSSAICTRTGICVYYTTTLVHSSRTGYFMIFILYGIYGNGSVRFTLMFASVCVKSLRPENHTFIAVPDTYTLTEDRYGQRASVADICARVDLLIQSQILHSHQRLHLYH